MLTIPDRALHTVTLIVRAIGSGKTSVRMYPNVEQLFVHRASDLSRQGAGLILEVKWASGGKWRGITGGS